MDNHKRGGRPAQAVGKLAFLGFALIAAYFLFTEHRAHLLGGLPYLLLLLCPIMHLFHHHGHGHHHGKSVDDSASEGRR